MPARAAIAYLQERGDGSEGEALLDEAAGRFAITTVVRDESGDERTRLAGVLHALVTGVAVALVTPRLRDVASSLRGLVALLDWFEAAGADLVALDVGLDTGSRSGRRVAATLREIASWERREPAPGRRGPGRPGIAAEAPELVERVIELRERGLSLQAIADRLNAERIPTPRGGARWRPSSVQAALGYRRPRPPAPGLAPPPPPPAHGPHGVGPRPARPGAPRDHRPHRPGPRS